MVKFITNLPSKIVMDIGRLILDTNMSYQAKQSIPQILTFLLVLKSSMWRYRSSHR